MFPPLLTATVYKYSIGNPVGIETSLCINGIDLNLTRSEWLFLQSAVPVEKPHFRTCIEATALKQQHNLIFITVKSLGF